MKKNYYPVAKYHLAIPINKEKDFEKAMTDLGYVVIFEKGGAGFLNKNKMIEIVEKYKFKKR